MDIAELKQKSVAELQTLAEQLNLTNYSGLRKQDLIFRIEQSLLDSDTVIRGEGVLEILPGVATRADSRSQKAFIVIDRSAGTRTIFWNRPSGDPLRPDELPQDLLRGADFLLLDGLMQDISLFGPHGRPGRRACP